MLSLCFSDFCHFARSDHFLGVSFFIEFSRSVGFLSVSLGRLFRRPVDALLRSSGAYLRFVALLGSQGGAFNWVRFCSIARLYPISSRTSCMILSLRWPGSFNFPCPVVSLGSFTFLGSALLESCHRHLNFITDFHSQMVPFSLSVRLIQLPQALSKHSS